MNHIHTIRVGEQEYPIGPAIDDTSVSANGLWSSQKILQQLGRLCPDISERGRTVRCQPLEGYPLQVTTFLQESAEELTLNLCGKNLFDHTAYPFEDVLIYDENGASNSATGFSAFKNYMPVTHLRGLTITLNHPGAEKNPNTHAALAFYDQEKNYISGSNGYSHAVPENAAYLRFSVPREYAAGTEVQLELGDAVTEFETYRLQTFSAQPTAAEHLWENIEAAGVCTLWSSAGETAVVGKADPVAILNRLTGQ